MVIYINIIFYHLYIENCDDLITGNKNLTKVCQTGYFNSRETKSWLLVLSGVE